MATERTVCNQLTWYDLVEPNIHDIAMLRRNFPFLKEVHLEDAISRIERPKFDRETDYLFIVMIFPLWDRATRLTRGSEIDFIIGRDFLVTAHDGVLKPMQQARFEIANDEAIRLRYMNSTSQHLAIELLNNLVDYIFPLLFKVEKNIHEIEETLFEQRNDLALIREMSLLRRDSFAVRRIIHQALPVLNQINHQITASANGDIEDTFGDIVDHMQKAHDMIDEDVEVLNALTDTADTLLTHRLNSVIRILTVISTIMLPLTLIVGAFGMNVSVPLEDNPDAFLIIFGLMLAISVTMLWYFHRRHWL